MGLFVLLVASFVAFFGVMVWQLCTGQLIDPAFSFVAREIPGWKRYFLWFSTAAYGVFAALCLWVIARRVAAGRAVRKAERAHRSRAR